MECSGDQSRESGRTAVFTLQVEEWDEEARSSGRPSKRECRFTDRELSFADLHALTTEYGLNLAAVASLDWDGRPGVSVVFQNQTPAQRDSDSDTGSGRVDLFYALSVDSVDGRRPTIHDFAEIAQALGIVVNLPNMSPVQKGLHILECTDHGVLLDDDDRRLVESAICGDLLDEALGRFDSLYSQARAGGLTRRAWFHGQENLTQTPDGSVYWRGIFIEQFQFGPNDRARERLQAEAVAMLCQSIERRGRVPNAAEYQRSVDELNGFEAAPKYFITAPADRQRLREVTVHAYRTIIDLSEALKAYLPDPDSSPYQSAQALRDRYCSATDWGMASAMSQDDETDIALLRSFCRCDIDTARALIRAATTGEPQRIESSPYPFHLYVIDNHIRGHYQFDFVRSHEEAQNVIFMRGQRDRFGSVAHADATNPHIVAAVEKLVLNGGLLHDREVLERFCATSKVPVVPGMPGAPWRGSDYVFL